MSEHRRVGKHGRLELLSTWVAAFLAMALPSGCGGHKNGAAPNRAGDGGPPAASSILPSSILPSPEAAKILSDLRARFDEVFLGALSDAVSQGERASLLPRGLAETFDAQSGALRPHFAASAQAVLARVFLPERSSAPLRLEDAASGMRID